MNTLNRHQELILGIAAVAAILMMGAFLRFYEIQTRPGYEWDEPIYAAISQRTTIVGYPNLKGEDNTYNTDVYLYHPPFDFYLKGAWFQLLGTSDIGAGRILSAIEGMIMLILAFFCLKEVSGKKVAVIGLIFLATDGWLVYTNRLNLIENGMMPWGILGIWLYVKAAKTQKTQYYLLTGIFLAFAAVYKHTGIPFVLVPLVNLLMIRRDWKNHLLTFQSMIIVVLLYVVAMLVLWQEDFLFCNWVQIERALGKIGSRGLNYGLSEVADAVVQTYWVFFITVLSIVTVGLTVGYRLFQVVFRGRQMPNSVLLSWALVAFTFMVAIALKAPHYLITVLIPAYMFIASELGKWLDGSGEKVKKEAEEKLVARKQWGIVGLMCILVVANVFTWNVRFIQHRDNALSETYSFFKTVSVNARVFADECVGVELQQPYFNLDRHPGEQGLKEVRPDYVVLYSSLTQKPPENPALSGLLSESQMVKHISGFKEDIQIYRVGPREGIFGE